jgi:hypothetical protein
MYAPSGLVASPHFIVKIEYHTCVNSYFLSAYSDLLEVLGATG